MTTTLVEEQVHEIRELLYEYRQFLWSIRQIRMGESSNESNDKIRKRITEAMKLLGDEE